MGDEERTQSINEWILEDLRSRNAEILVKERTRSHLSTFALVVLGAAVAFLAQDSSPLSVEWVLVGSFGLAAFFGFLGHLALYLAFFQVITSDYIRFDVLPRARRLLRSPRVALYGWEEYLWSQRRKSWLTMSAYFISEGALFVLPALGFVAYGSHLLRGNVRSLSKPGFAAFAVLVLVLIWLLMAGIRTTWVIVHSDRRFRKHEDFPSNSGVSPRTTNP